MSYNYHLPRPKIIQQEQQQEIIITPKKLPNPVLQSQIHKQLHRELLWRQRSGHLLPQKTELQRAIEKINPSSTSPTSKKLAW